MYFRHLLTWPTDNLHRVNHCLWNLPLFREVQVALQQLLITIHYLRQSLTQLVCKLRMVLLTCTV
jgi:hypothetical protein